MSEFGYTPPGPPELQKLLETAATQQRRASGDQHSWFAEFRANRARRKASALIKKAVGVAITDSINTATEIRSLPDQPTPSQQERLRHLHARRDSLQAAFAESIRLDADAAIAGLTDPTHMANFSSGALRTAVGIELTALAAQTLKDMAREGLSEDPLDTRVETSLRALQTLTDAQTGESRDVMGTELACLRARVHESRGQSFEAYRAWTDAGAPDEAMRVVISHLNEIAALSDEAAFETARDAFGLDLAEHPELVEELRATRDRVLADTGQHDLLDLRNGPNTSIGAAEQAGREFFLKGDFRAAAAVFAFAESLRDPSSRGRMHIVSDPKARMTEPPAVEPRSPELGF